MSTLRHQHHRRRSHSASPSSPNTRAQEKSWRAANKRVCAPHNLVKDASSPQKWDVDIGGRGKRRRQDTPIPPFVLGDRYNATAPFSSFFATKASDFELFSRRDRDTKIRYRSDHFIDTRSMDLDDDDEHKLSHLRSNAFWELHRSVAENGEGLVRRMRDYEYSRSRTDAYHKAKEAQKRGRKRSSIVALSRKPKHVRPSSDNDQGEEDDDVQIFAGELPRISLPGSLGLPKRPTSSKNITVPTSRQSSSTFTTRESSPSIYPSDDEERKFFSGTGSPITRRAPLHPPSSPCDIDHKESSHGPLDTLSILPSVSPLCSPTICASRTEKAIAALSLAMANGAGGIADYEALLAVQALPSMDDCQVGEMWH
ncbi:hypothetical protein C0995_006754 [Termitomyces sp. Mi166|nr:hypothetical protein C0995_006754 [Termitomyces sp. Mi166\